MKGQRQGVSSTRRIDQPKEYPKDLDTINKEKEHDILISAYKM